LLLWCAGSLESWHGGFLFQYYNKFYDDKLCFAPVCCWRREDGGAS
jgi:hypothetical protein